VTGLFYGDAGQLYANLIGIVANVLWVAPVAALSFWVIGKLVGNRASAESEIAGLDVDEMGVHGYVFESASTHGSLPRGVESPAPVPAAVLAASHE
jgi:Amt family ammonium transporter